MNLKESKMDVFMFIFTVHVILFTRWLITGFVKYDVQSGEIVNRTPNIDLNQFGFGV